MELRESLQALIQGLVRERIVRHWPLVRAFECRRDSSMLLCAGLHAGEWCLFAPSAEDGSPRAGIVRQVGVSGPLHSECFSPPCARVAVFSCVPGTHFFVNWSDTEDVYVRAQALLAVGFSMERVHEFPLDLPLELRRPNWRRRLGPAYVMPEHVRLQLLPHMGEAYSNSQ